MAIRIKGQRRIAAILPPRLSAIDGFSLRASRHAALRRPRDRTAVMPTIGSVAWISYG